jgi:hypothetical protein
VSYAAARTETEMKEKYDDLAKFIHGMSILRSNLAAAAAVGGSGASVISQQWK